MQRFEPLFSSADELEAFSDAIGPGAPGWTLEYREQVSSTSDWALQAARAGAGHGKTLVADAQTAGRGQRGRSWHSPPGAGLLFSSIVRGPGLTPDRMGWVALCAGWACAEALHAEAGIEVRLKWPNDLVALTAAPRKSWQKLGGILVESRVTEQLRVEYAVVGVGLNVNQQREELPQDARTPPASLRLLTGRVLGRRALLAAVLQRLALRFEWVRGSGDFVSVREGLREAYRSWWGGWMLRVRTPQGERAGQFESLTPHGRLRLTGPDGRAITLSDAEWIHGECAAP